MTTVSRETDALPGPDAAPTACPTVAVVGNPNSGKTTLFNRLTGLRAQTANFAGTTVSHRHGKARLGETTVELVDLPGLYSLEALTTDEKVARAALAGELPGRAAPDAVLVVVDATALERNLFVTSQVLELGRPTLVALNMMDVADREGLRVDVAGLAERLGCAVVPVSARKGQGIEELNRKLEQLIASPTLPLLESASCGCTRCSGCDFATRYDWAESVRSSTLEGDLERPGRLTDAIDRVLTHRIVGLVEFAAVMLLTFLLIFWLAQIPMDLIDGLFALAGQTVGTWLPEGDLRSLITDGLIGGVGGILVFLPQICILFFVLALLEDTGYLSRAAFVMDRLMHRVGLPGKAFVPMLSAHACAIPAIMSTRIIGDRRDRLATIMVIPLMTCSARVPVYAMVVALLFPRNPVMAAAVFAGAYALGIVAALAMAFCFKKTLLAGRTQPLMIELPNYRVPSLRNAIVLTADRSWSFIKNAGTTILVISLVMWAAATYPKTTVEDLSSAQQATLASIESTADVAPAERAAAAENYLQMVQLENSAAGRVGRFVEPIFAPAGFDWKISIGVMTSFAAREVIVSTLAVLYGLGEEGGDEEQSLLAALENAKRTDGGPVFTTATCLSLLVFYVLAMQCLPTQVVTAKETNSWKWPAIQFGYMTVLAYVAAVLTYQVAMLAGLTGIAGG